MSPEGEWEPEAKNWIRWARTNQHDAYWYYRDSFFDQIVPRLRCQSVEIGCGEGRVARDLHARGHNVVGVDTSITLVASARDHDHESSYALADGAALPFPDGCFELAVAYNSLQVVADMPGTVREAARVLGSGGYFCFCISHPWADVGRFVDDELDAAFVVRDDYFSNRRVEDKVERDGLEMTFRGWTYSLEDYSVALERAGLRIEAMREPRPAAATLPRYQRFNRVPLFLSVRAIKSY